MLLFFSWNVRYINVSDFCYIFLFIQTWGYQAPQICMPRGKFLDFRFLIGGIKQTADNQDLGKKDKPKHEDKDGNRTYRSQIVHMIDKLGNQITKHSCHQPKGQAGKNRTRHDKAYFLNPDIWQKIIKNS